MPATTVLNDDQWSKLLEYVAETYNEVTLSRGFHFYKQQMVTSLKILDSRSIDAHVEEFGETCQVLIDFDSLKASICTCPVHKSCKHLAASLMELADRQGYPASQIMNAKMALKRVAAQATKASTLEQLPGMTVDGWHKFMEHYTYLIKSSFDQGGYVQSLRGQFSQLHASKAALSPVDALYFELHEKLFILRKIVEQNAQTGVTFYTAATIYNLSDELEDWLKEAAPRAAYLQACLGERMAQTLAYIRAQQESEAPNKLTHFRVFTTIWTYWICEVAQPQNTKDRALSPDVLSFMEKELAAYEAMKAADLSLSLCASRAFLKLYQQQTESAWDVLDAHSSFKDAPTVLFVPFLSYLENSRELIVWLQRLLPFYARKRQLEVEIYFGYWKKAVAQFPEMEAEMWLALGELLPSSYRLIESLLYEQRKWKAWIEMQIVQGYDPFAHRVSVLQPIEKESPELLLPYYHQAVEHYIRLKNRHDYKSAVRLLKRLEKVYKKMKQPERWEAFFTRFVSRYSRLRALQEELKKGKLLE
ncbi:hypothetical protein [Paenibacillus roseipurpureus]|uniref:SWIM-type domain-containing protein n=1 Tax=Paenibacillus roseopurpureus TaxID=2918901 RepID=A0AA96LQ70_9BACL|nr:hypothetical protein [Paenibacillus sp. MBLB1832]WNR46247.1 hypothetical protein MJB10_09180 [Paenibacillus sp. MBLB1832]